MKTLENLHLAKPREIDIFREKSPWLSSNAVTTSQWPASRRRPCPAPSCAASPRKSETPAAIASIFLNGKSTDFFPHRTALNLMVIERSFSFSCNGIWNIHVYSVYDLFDLPLSMYHFFTPLCSVRGVKNPIKYCRDSRCGGFTLTSWMILQFDWWEQHAGNPLQNGYGKTKHVRSCSFSFEPTIFFDLDVCPYHHTMIYRHWGQVWG